MASAVSAQKDVVRMKRCVQCFQDVPKDGFSKRQYHQMDGKCSACVAELEDSFGTTTNAEGKWTHDQYYRCCHRGKTGGVSVRVKCNVASPILGHIPLGRVFRATDWIYNEQGDPMVKLETLDCVQGLSDETKAKPRDGWVPCRSIRNEVLIENHDGPFLQETGRFFRCVIEGCKARTAPDLEQSEIGYVLYGDVVEVLESMITTDGVAFLRLHPRYFDGPAWVVERSLDNESVLNAVEGPSTDTVSYRCVQESGAPTRSQPSLASPPVGRIPCGAVVRVVERVVTPQRQIFLRIQEKEARGKAKAAKQTEGVWVIETSTCCASVMRKLSCPQ